MGLFDVRPSRDLYQHHGFFRPSDLGRSNIDGNIAAHGLGAAHSNTRPLNSLGLGSFYLCLAISSACGAVSSQCGQRIGQPQHILGIWRTGAGWGQDSMGLWKTDGMLFTLCLLRVFPHIVALTGGVVYPTTPLIVTKSVYEGFVFVGPPRHSM